MSSPPIVGVPSLMKWLSGPSFRIRLPKPTDCSRRMYGGMRMTIEREGEQQALDQLDGAHRIGAAAHGRFAARRVDEPVEADPARRLDEDDVAVAQPRRERARGPLSASRTRTIRAGAEAGRLGALGDARRAVADHDEPVDRPCGRLADRAMARRRAASPSSSISPSTATRRPGSPASRSSAARPSRARRCTCRRRR